MILIQTRSIELKKANYKETILELFESVPYHDNSSNINMLKNKKIILYGGGLNNFHVFILKRHGL